MRYSKIIRYDSSNGPGLRSTIFLSGCNIHCPSCFNPELQDFNHGDLLTTRVIREWIQFINDNKSVLNGISVLGGEPFDQDLDRLAILIDILNKCNLPIWMWTGHKLEELLQNPKIKDIIISNHNLVGLVDGPFINDLRNLSLRFRGSSNQRVINIAETRRLNFRKVILYDEYMDNQIIEGE